MFSALQGQIPQVERLGREHVSPHEQQLAGLLDVFGIGIGCDNELAII
jgi:hypothetical protein